MENNRSPMWSIFNDAFDWANAEELEFAEQISPPPFITQFETAPQDFMTLLELCPYNDSAEIKDEISSISSFGDPDSPNPESPDSGFFEEIKIKSESESDSTNWRAKVPRKGTCPECHKKFSRLHTHFYSVHLNEKPFQCENCDQHFAQKIHLTRHKVVKHSAPKLADRKAHLCPGCGKGFSRKDKLKTHLSRVCKGVPYKKG